MSTSNIIQQAKDTAAAKAAAAVKAKEAINDPTAAATPASSNTAAKDEAIRHPTTPAASVMESSVPVDSPDRSDPRTPADYRKTDKNEWNEEPLGGSNTPTIPPNVYADKTADTNKTDETIYTQGDDGTIIPDKDLPVPANGFKNKGLNQFYTSDGGKVVPDAAGYFVPENEEQWDALTRYAEKHDLVEAPSNSSSVRGKKDQEAYKSKK